MQETEEVECKNNLQVANYSPWKDQYSSKEENTFQDANN